MKPYKNLFLKTIEITKNYLNLVEAHCYSIVGAGQLLNNHVAVETD